MEADRRVTIDKMVEEFGQSKPTIHDGLHEDLRLILKCARWVPKMLSDKHKAKTIHCSEFMIKEEFHHGKGSLDFIITMDESNVLFHP